MITINHIDRIIFGMDYEIKNNAVHPLPFSGPSYAAIYNMTSYINHSCVPNIISSVDGLYDGHSITWTAERDVKKGEELFRNYVHMNDFESDFDRQNFLKKRYHFDCKCPLCSVRLKV